jgi:hypothetical protein
MPPIIQVFIKFTALPGVSKEVEQEMAIDIN